MPTLTDRPELNPDISSFISSVSEWAKTKRVETGDNVLLMYFGAALLLVALIALVVYYYRSSRLFETQDNIQRLIKDATRGASVYDINNPKRVGIRSYLTKLKASGVPDTHMILGNFYVSTANATGIFLPGKDGTASPMAARAAVLGGARAFVFDIWPDLTPGAEFAPILQVVESGSLWRRISMNSTSFITVLRTLIQEAFEIKERPGSEDPVILYLRFRGKPRDTTFRGVANTLRTTCESYRLDASFNNCKSQDKVFTQLMTNLFKKVIIMSNVRAEGNILSDFINVGPKDGIKTEYTLADIRGLSAENRVAAVQAIKQNLTFVAPLPEDDLAAANYAVSDAQDIGVHYCAMNFFNPNDALKTYLAADMFGTQSFKLKPEALRYTVEVLPTPRVPEDPRWGAGPTAGTPTMPPAIRIP